MITEIGIIAGEIWELLEREDSVELSDAVKRLLCDQKVAYMALGWLAREGHVLFRRESGVTFVELNKRIETHV